MAVSAVYTVCGVSVFSGNMADMVHLQHPDQFNGVAAEGGQYGIASFVRSSPVNVRGEYKATLFQGYQGNIGRKVGDLHIECEKSVHYEASAIIVRQLF